MACVPEKERISTWPVTGVDLQTLYVDMPWLDTDIESLNYSYRYDLDGYRYRIYNQLLTDVPWLDTGIESGTSRLQICPGWRQVSNL